MTPLTKAGREVRAQAELATAAFSDLRLEPLPDIPDALDPAAQLVARAQEALRLPKVFERFFETKTARDAEGTMAFFAPDMVCYIDATLGWEFDSHAALQACLL